jgi:hypothetical protein
MGGKIMRPSMCTIGETESGIRLVMASSTEELEITGASPVLWTILGSTSIREKHASTNVMCDLEMFEVSSAKVSGEVVFILI